MAYVTCPICDHVNPESQSACEVCGAALKPAAPRKRLSTETKIIVGVGLLVVFLFGSCAFVTFLGAITDRNKKPHVRTVDPVRHQKARELIDQATQLGVWSKIEPPTNGIAVADAWVGPSFYAATYDQKTSFTAVVYSYYFEGTDDADSGLVRLLDTYTGKEVGVYSHGLLQIY